MLDRYTTFNDDRGLGEGLTDNLPTPSRLRILLESRVQSVPKGEGAPEGGASPSGYVVEYPSLGSHLAQQSLLNPIFVGYTAITAAITAQKNKGKSVQLMLVFSQGVALGFSSVVTLLMFLIIESVSYLMLVCGMKQIYCY